MTDTPKRIDPLPRPPDVTIRPPGSKSLTNRALALAGLARGTSRLTGALVADDTAAMIGALRNLGVGIDDVGAGVVQVQGGLGISGTATIDARLSGTTSRFVLPIAARSGVPVLIDGAAGLRRRPLGQLAAALESLGVEIDWRGEPGHLPVVVDGRRAQGRNTRIDGSASSQFLSALLLAGPVFPDGLTVRADGGVVARPFVDMTLQVMGAFGARVSEPEAETFVVEPGGLVAREFAIEPDATAATYFLAAAAITGGRVRIEGLGRNSIQGDVAFADVLVQMGAELEVFDDAMELRGGALRGIDVDLSAHPDTAQTLAVVAVFADSSTRVRGVGFTRGHETDRPAAVVTELRRLGIGATETDDGFTVEPGTPQSATVATYGDHRMAMSFALLGLRVPGIAIADPEVVAKTYPGYFADLERLRTDGEPAQG